MRDTTTKYEERSREVFGTRQSPRSRERSVPDNGAGGGIPKNDARPVCEPAAGARILLTPEQVVHDLLNLRAIRDPGRWLKRHGAPVAIDTGHEKRFLAAEVLQWAAAKFSPDEASRESLQALGESFVSLGYRGGRRVGANKPGVNRY